MQLHLPVLRRDPWWDLEGKGARRLRARKRIESGLAFLLAVGSFSFVLALWIAAFLSWLPS
jgi:hypothetical protein